MVRAILRSAARASRKYEMTYRYASNLHATLEHRRRHRDLDARQQKVLEDLNRDGVAITNVTDFFGDCPLFDEMQTAVDDLERAQHDVLEEERKNANSSGEVGGRKPYVRYLLDDRPVLDLDSVYVRFALQRAVIRLTNAYFGMVTRFAYFNVWHTYKQDAAPRSSQLWHRDFDDPHYIMKMFVYMTDVDERSGPLSYAAGSHSKGRMSREPDYVAKSSNSRRSSDEQMAEVIPRDRWIQATGPKGTIVFADTHGYHKGGWAKSRERIVYTCMFTSPTVQLRSGHEQFIRPGGLELPADPEAAAVLSPRT